MRNAGLAGLGLAVVAGTAFVVSYMHQYELVIDYGNPPLTATLLPISVDGLIVMASVCLAVIAERRREITSANDLEVSRDVITTSEQVSDQMVSTPRQPRARRYTPTVAEKVTAYAAKHPDAEPAVIARKLGCTERTVRRHLAAMPVDQPVSATADTDPVERINGTAVPALVEVAG